MPLTDFRAAASWKAAINIGPGLVRLAEELPASEQLGLAWQLQQVMVDLPATVAFDLQDNDRDTRVPVVLRLIAALDLIERVYPALDTTAVRQEADELVTSLTSDGFRGTATPRAAQPAAREAATMQTDAQPAPAAEPHRVSIPVVAEHAAPAPSVIIAPPPAAQAQPDQDDHVHTDSVQ